MKAIRLWLLLLLLGQGLNVNAIPPKDLKHLSAMPSDIQAVQEEEEDTAEEEDPVWAEQEEGTWEKLDRVPYWDLKYELNPWNRLDDRDPNPSGNIYIP